MLCNKQIPIKVYIYIYTHLDKIVAKIIVEWMAMSECVRRVSTLQSLTSELPRLLLYLPFDSITLFAFFAQPRTPVLLFGDRFYARGPKASSARMQPLQPYADLGWCPTIMPLTASFQFVFAQLMRICFCICVFRICISPWWPPML